MGREVVTQGIKCLSPTVVEKVITGSARSATKLEDHERAVIGWLERDDHEGNVSCVGSGLAPRERDPIGRLQFAVGSADHRSISAYRGDRGDTIVSADLNVGLDFLKRCDTTSWMPPLSHRVWVNPGIPDDVWGSG